MCKPERHLSRKSGHRKFLKILPSALVRLDKQIGLESKILGLVFHDLARPTATAKTLKFVLNPICLSLLNIPVIQKELHCKRNLSSSNRIQVYRADEVLAR